MNVQLDKAINLRNEGNLKEANLLLISLVKSYPNHAEVNYHCAWSFDVLGEEAKAVPYYERAIELGLADKELEGAMLGLGSTYRTLGDYENSRRIFQKAITLFPNNQAFPVFYSMTLYNLQHYDQAMEILLNCLVDTTSDTTIKQYEKAIRFYSDKLGYVWE